MRKPLLLSAATALGVTGLLTLASTPASARPAHAGTPIDRHTAGTYTARVLLSGNSLHHEVNGSRETLSKPDDIVARGGKLFVAFQNGVGSQGEASPTGNTASTIVEMNRHGHVKRQWDLTGKVDGLGVDPASEALVATVNEDGNSSLYTIDPEGAHAGRVTHYVYDQDPLPHGGGTDAVSFVDGLMLISASAPATPDGPAVYSVTLQAPATPGGAGIAKVSPLFDDNASATQADPGAPSTLALTDPDSNIAVPASAPRFAGDFMLDSQGDQEQIYVAHPGTTAQSLSVLQLSQSVDDTAFATRGHGILLATDPTTDSVDAVTGPFRRGEALVAVTPCGANDAPATCPAPPAFPPNYLGTLDLQTGQISPIAVSGASLNPQGMIFIGRADRPKR